MTIQAEYALFQGGCFISDLTWFSGGFSSWFALDHDVEIDEFLGERRHVVFEAEGVFAYCICGEDIVTLTFIFTVEDVFVIWVLEFKVYFEGTARLDGKVELGSCERGEVKTKKRRTPIFWPALSTSA